MENLFPLPQGAAQKRPGTKYIATARDSNYPVRLIPFEYSTDESYIIASSFILGLGNGAIDFFTDSNTVTTVTSTTTVDANTIALWPLDDNTDSNFVSDACDVYDGNLTDGYTEDIHSSGKVGSGCFDFSNYGGCAVIDDNDNLTFSETSSPFSISGWIFVQDTAEIQTIVSKWEEGVGKEYRLQLLSDERLRLELSDNSTAVLDANCISQWKLNEDAADATVVDAMGTSNGTASTNTEDIAIEGKLNGAFNFWYQPENCRYVTVSDADDYTFIDGSNNDEPFSVAAWVSVDDIHDGSSDIIAKWMHRYSDGNREWRLAVAGTYSGGWQVKFAFELHDMSVNDSSTADTGWLPISRTNWWFVVATYDGRGSPTASQGQTIYVNAVDQTSVQTTDAGYEDMENHGADVIIAGADNTGKEYPGKIDNVMIFDKELSQAEINALYASGSGTEELAGGTAYATTDDPLEDGFRFIIATYDSTGGATAANGIDLYVDGEAIDITATNYDNYTAMENTTADFRIGAQLSSESEEQYVFSNRLDHIAIYDSNLTPSDINELYTTTTYWVSIPYDYNVPFNVHYTQSADVLFFAHSNSPPSKLSRYADNWWEYEVVDFSNGPFLDENITDITLTPSAVTGNITVTASSQLFSPNDVNSLWQIIYTVDSNEVTGTFSGADQNSITVDVQKGRSYKFTTHGTWTGTCMIQRSYDDGTTWKDVGGSVISSGDDDNIALSGTEEDGDAIYRVYMKTYTSTPTYDLVALSYDVEGTVYITGYTSNTVVSATVRNDLGGTTATERWSEAAWSRKRGYPRTVEFFEDRLWYGGTYYQPDTVWGSVVGDYNNFDAGSNDDDAVIFTLTSRQVNMIRWLVGKNKLIIGTSGSEWTLSGGDEPITPSNVQAKQQSSYGSCGLQAELANEAILFFQRGGKKMRELAYNWELDSYIAPDMTILAKDVTGDGIVDTAFQQIPDSILWCVRSDGNMATFSYERNEKVTSWSRQETEGNFESVAKIHGDPEDEIWVSVLRTIDGNDYRYIEQFQPRDFGSEVNDAYFVDCGATYENVNEITDLTWLEGESILCLADGDVLEVNDVNNGTVTLGDTYTTVHIGLPFTVQLRTMPLSWLGQGYSIQGRMKRIGSIIPEWYESGDFYFGKDVDHKELTSIDRMTTDVSGNWKTMPPGYDRRGYIYFYQRSPEPFTLLSVAAEFEVD